VIWHLIKDDHFRDNPPNADFRPGNPPHESLLPRYSADRPEVLDVVTEMRNVVDEFAERVLIGETYLPFERLVAYYGANLSGAHLPFNFSLLSAPWKARTIAKLIDDYEATLPSGAWPNWVLGNHDRPQVASRVGPKQTRVAAMLLLTLRGTPTMYYGDEIGLRQVAIGPDQIRDPFEKNVPGIGVGRDGCRTPMQWTANAHAGFTTGQPWLPLAQDYVQENVENQSADGQSILSLYRALISLRKAMPQLETGAYVRVVATGNLLAYGRESLGKPLLITLNLGSDPISITSDAIDYAGEILLSTNLDRTGEMVRSCLDLRGDEGLIIRLS
jgi:alpha-glucosidase